jgi:hypothetical protein
MSKRLQVVLDDEEFEEIQRVARRRRMTLSEWVRQSLRESRKEEPAGDVDQKLAAVREAAVHAYPTADIEEMLDQIEAGYGGDGA